MFDCFGAETAAFNACKTRLLQKNGESRRSENKSENSEKEPTLRRIPHKIFSSGAAGALLIYAGKRLAVGQAGALPPHCFINSRIVVTILVAGSLRRLNNFCYYFVRQVSKVFPVPISMFFLPSGLKKECVRLILWESCGLLVHFLVSFLCVDAEDSSLTNKTERADTQRKQKTKGTKIKIIPLSKSSALALQEGSVDPR